MENSEEQVSDVVADPTPALGSAVPHQQGAEVIADALLEYKPVARELIAALRERTRVEQSLVESEHQAQLAAINATQVERIANATNRRELGRIVGILLVLLLVGSCVVLAIALWVDRVEDIMNLLMAVVGMTGAALGGPYIRDTFGRGRKTEDDE